MSFNQTPELAAEQFTGDMNFTAFDMFTDDTYFDSDNLPSCDIPLPSVETSEDVPGTFFDSVIDFDFDVGGLHSDMSVWGSGDFLGYSGGIQGEDWASSRTSKVPEELPAGSVEVTTPASQHTEVLPATTLPTPPGPIETLWRPLVGSTPAKKSLANPPTRSRAPPRPRVWKPKPAVAAKVAPKPKVNKVVKTRKPAASQKRTTSAPSGPPRSVQKLYNLPWSHLSQEEKGCLLLPLLQGIDPNTGIKIGEPGTLLPPPEFEMIGEDIFGTGDSGAKFMGILTPKQKRKVTSLTTSSPTAMTTQSGQSPNNNGASSASYVPDMIGETSFNTNNPIDLTGQKNPTRNIDDEDAARFRARMEANKKQPMMAQPTVSDFTFDHVDTSQNNTSNIAMDDMDDIDAAVFRSCQAFNRQHDLMTQFAASDMPDFSFDEPNFDIYAGFKPAGQGLGGPCGNGFIGDSVQKNNLPSSNVVNALANANAMVDGELGQMPTPSGEYGRKRQQEALKRNAMLCAAGRRR